MKNKLSHNELLQYVNELEKKIQHLEVKLEENRFAAEKLKSNFLSNISHELRTPMNAILGFSNLIISKDLSSDKKEEYVEHLHQSGNSLLKIVELMIDVSLLEINELKIIKEPCRIDILFQQIYHYYNIDKRKLGKDHLALLFNKDKRVNEILVHTDQFRLTQVISSLLSNALKFTNKGVIEFGYFLRDDDKLQFFVTDSGKGILAEKASTLFNKFEKLDEDYGCTEGIGLGLTLARGIIRLLGGEIWVESNVFKGSTFSFTIDYKDNIMENSSSKKQTVNTMLY